ncbi:MAG: hypothetical protein RL757_874 [Bacteroidota bacterium]|jgi:hypothetical protein
MSDLKLKVFNGCLGASIGVLTGLFDLISTPAVVIKTNAERLDPLCVVPMSSGKLGSFSLVLSIVKFFSDFTYHYDEKMEDITKDKDKGRKWMMYGILAGLMIMAGITFYMYYGKNEKVKRFLSGIFFPLFSLGMSTIFFFRALNSKHENDKYLAGLGLFSSILGMWKFKPIKQALAQDPVDGSAIIAGISFVRMASSGMKFIFLPYSNAEKGSSPTPLQLA